MLTSCVSIPKETLTLSKTLGNDLVILHNSHRDMVQLYYQKIKDNINEFVDEVYAPYFISNLLNAELVGYKNGESSLYKSIEDASKSATSEVTKEALSYMQDVLELVKQNIDQQKESLLSPIETQEKELLNKINRSYENVLLANTSITNYLKSIQKLKETQQEVLSIVGLSGADTTIINTLMNVSEKVNDVVKAGKKIDIESDKALEKIDKLSEKIKKLTTKK
jgi:hypothetical protein